MKYNNVLLGAACAITLAYIAIVCPVFSEGPAPASPKAVTETSPKDGFKLSGKAIQRLGLRFEPVSTAGSVSISQSALVHSLEVVGVYRVRDGWIKLIPVGGARVTSKGAVEVRSAELQAGDQVITQGVALVRVADMEAFGGGE